VMDFRKKYNMVNTHASYVSTYFSYPFCQK
jgi:hypothetical protein